jgi:hypothetical protein
MEHVAIMDKDTINKILNGTKTIESRFSKNKITPYQKVSIGDTIYLKETGKDIIATFLVDRVVYFDNLTPDMMKDIRERYGKSINAPDDYWNLKSDTNYGTLMYIKNPKSITPIKFNKKGRAGFVSKNNI